MSFASCQWPGGGGGGGGGYTKMRSPGISTILNWQPSDLEIYTFLIPTQP